MMWFMLACLKSPQLPTYQHVVSRIEKTYPYEALPSAFVDASLELEREVKKAKTPEELRPIVTDLLTSLSLSHYAIIPSAEEKSTQQGFYNIGTLGMTLRLIDDAFYVVGISPEHPNPESIELGWGVVSVDGVPLPEGGSNLRRTMRAQRQLFCEQGQDVTIEIKIDESTTKTQQQSCVSLSGELFTFGNVPTQSADFHHRVLDDGIHYMAFHHFLTPIREPFVVGVQQAVSENAPGLIIDLRGNTGGMIAVGQGMVGYLISESNLLFAQQQSQDAEFRYIIYPRAEAERYSGPIVVLIDEISVSTAELFARILQISERATIIGTPSAGRVLSSMVEGLPNGDRLQLVIADLTSMDGQSLEGVGVVPDIHIPYELDSLKRQEDAVLLAAQAHIITQSGDSQ